MRFVGNFTFKMGTIMGFMRCASMRQSSGERRDFVSVRYFLEKIRYGGHGKGCEGRSFNSELEPAKARTLLVLHGISSVVTLASPHLPHIPSLQR